MPSLSVKLQLRQPPAFCLQQSQLLHIGPTTSSCCMCCLVCCCYYGRSYNTVMKLVFLGTSCGIVYYMRYDRIIRLTYDKDQDTFRHWMLIAPSAFLALVTSHPRTLMEV